MIVEMTVTRRRSEVSPFNGCRPYVSRLQILLGAPDQGTSWRQEVTAALNGGPSAALRRVATVQTRRQYGAFFTSALLSEALLNKSAPFSGIERTFYDAACGMG